MVKAYELTIEQQENISLDPLLQIVPNNVYQKLLKLGIKSYWDLNESFWSGSIENLVDVSSDHLSKIKEWFDEHEVNEDSL